MQDDEPPAITLDEPGLAACYAAAAQGVCITGDRAGQPTLRLVVPQHTPATSRAARAADAAAANRPAAEVRGVNVYACAQPKVPLGELTALSGTGDTQEQALIDAFIGLTPQGETPLSAALDGALQWGMGYLNQTSGEKAAVVLVTDGAPTDCNTTQGYLTGAAAGALASHGLLTFAIGLDGSNEDLMNAIAAAGGTGQGYYIGSGSDVQTELVAAFDEIRDATIACEYRVPDEAGGEPIEPTAVNVLYTPAGSSASTTIGQVGGHDACTPSAGGWYYDNPADPTKIIFCPSTCSAVQNDNGGRVDLIFGCATIPA